MEAGEDLRVNDQLTTKQKRESPTLRRAHDGGGVDESPRVREGRRGRGGNRREQGRRARRGRPAWERRPARVGAAGPPKARSRGPPPSLELCYQILAIGQIRRVSPLVSGGVTAHPPHQVLNPAAEVPSPHENFHLRLARRVHRRTPGAPGPEALQAVYIDDRADAHPKRQLQCVGVGARRVDDLERPLPACPPGPARTWSPGWNVTSRRC